MANIVRPFPAPVRRVFPSWVRALILGLACAIIGASAALLWAWHEWKDTMRPDQWPWKETNDDGGR